MARTAQSMFIEEDDNDINTTSTEEEHDPDREYDVECVLAEQQDADGRIHYLIKWEGYALYDCTWETKDSITSDVVLRHWDQDKRLVRSGEKQPFDIDDYNRAFEEHAEEQERKRKLRKKKRRQRGRVVTSSEDDSDSTSSYDLPTTETPKRTRAKVTSPVKKNGIAQPVKRRNTFSKSTSDESRPVTQNSDLDSLFGEPIEKTVAPSPSRLRKSATLPQIPTAKALTPTTGIPASNASMRGPTSPKKSAAVPPPDQREATVSNISNTASSARKSAPAGTTGTTRPASKTNVFANWTKEKKPRQRPRVSGETEKDSTDPKFSHLAVQNRYQKYSRNEPAPNPDALVMIDPKTGKTQPPQTPTVRSGPENIHSAYGRGRSPPRQKQRTPSPLSSPRSKQSDVQGRVDQSTSAPAIATANQVVFDSSTLHRFSKIHVTCRYWREGNCSFTSENCRFVHAEIKKNVTCHYWARNGKCRKSDEECDFCHYWTTETAGEPGSFLRRNSVAASGVPESEVGELRIESPTENLVTPSSPVVQFAPTPAVAQTAQPVEREGDSPAQEPVTDPRLRGRAPRADKTSMRAAEATSTEKSAVGSVEPTSVNNIDVEMTDARFSHGSLESDLEMAKRGVEKLDPAKLLTFTDNEKKEVQHVFISMPDRPEELEVLRTYFIGLNRHVYTSKEAGAWTLFRTTYGSRDCLLVLHPTELFTGTIPGLYDLLVRYGASFRVFSIGVQHARCIRERRKPAYEAQRLFPLAGFIFISDDVFVYYPDKATQIIEEFIKNRKEEPKAGRFWKLGARPGVKNWLLKLACEKMEQHAADGAAMPYVQLYDSICRLCPLEDEDLTDPDQHNPKESSHLWSPPATSLPSFKDKWETDEATATAQMVDFFAGEACSKAWKHRKFHFIYQRPEHTRHATNSQGEEEEQVERDPHGWGKKYCHIGIKPPDSILKTLTKT